MTLIAIILVLVTERYWRGYPLAGIFRRLGAWGVAMRRGLVTRAWLNGPVGALLMLMPAALPVAALQFGLEAGDGAFMEVLHLLFSVLVLALCVGDRWFSEFVRHYLESWRNGDLEGASQYLRQVPAADRDITNPRQLNRRFLEMMFDRANERVLSQVFWFVVLGPLGAVIYRMLCQLRHHISMETARTGTVEGLDEALLRLKAILEWLPARLAILGFAISGSFVDTMHAWGKRSREWVADWNLRNVRLFRACGLGALQLEEFYSTSDSDIDLATVEAHVARVRDMIRRMLFVFITVLAAMTLAGWLP